MVAMAVTHLLDLEVGDFLMDMVEVVAKDSHTVVMAVDTTAFPEGEDFHQEDTVVVYQVDMEVVVVDSHSEDQEDQVVEVHLQEEAFQSDPVVEDSCSVDLEAVVGVVAVVHPLHQEEHTPYLLLVQMMTHSTVNQISRRTRTTSRSKIDRTGSGVCVTYYMPKEWNKCWT